MPDKKPIPVIPPLVKDQYDFVNSYINSPMYKQRLQKLANTERMLEGGSSFNKFSGNELFAGSSLNENSSALAANAVAMSKNNLLNVKPNIKIGDFNLGRGVGGAYDSSYNDLRMSSDYLKDNQTIPVHELSHATLDGAYPYSANFNKKYVSSLLKTPGSPGWEPEVQKPGELKARLDAIRYLLKKEGIYDAGTENFDNSHLEKLKKSKAITNDFNFKQLNDQLNDKHKNTGLIWLLNNIAQVDNQNSNINKNA